MKKEESNNIDWASQLPQHILQREIIHRLPPLEQARACVLSKVWNQAWSYHTFFTFFEDRFSCRDALIRYVDGRLRHCVEHKLVIDRIEIRARDFFSEWFNLAIQRNLITDLYLEDITSGYPPWPIPPRIGKTLQVLTLKKCTLPSDYLVDVPNFLHLRKLVLEYVTILDGKTLEKLISPKVVESLELSICECHNLEHLKLGGSFPRLTNIKVKHCFDGMAMKITIQGAPNLKTAAFADIGHNLTDLEMDAPCLESFCFSGVDGCLYNFTLQPSQFLKEVSLSSQVLLNANLYNFLSSASTSEAGHDHMMGTISSSSLRRLLFGSHEVRANVTIDAPNLTALTTWGYVSFDVVDSSNLTEIQIESYIDENYGFWHPKLVHFFQKLKSPNDITLAFLTDKMMIAHQDPRGIRLPLPTELPENSYFKIFILSEGLAYESLMAELDNREYLSVASPDNGELLKALSKKYNAGKCKDLADQIKDDNLAAALINSYQAMDYQITTFNEKF